MGCYVNRRDLSRVVATPHAVERKSRSQPHKMMRGWFGLHGTHWNSQAGLFAASLPVMLCLRPFILRWDLAIVMPYARAAPVCLATHPPPPTVPTPSYGLTTDCGMHATHRPLFPTNMKCGSRTQETYHRKTFANTMCLRRTHLRDHRKYHVFKNDLLGDHSETMLETITETIVETIARP